MELGDENNGIGISKKKWAELYDFQKNECECARAGTLATPLFRLIFIRRAAKTEDTAVTDAPISLSIVHS